MPRKGVMLAKPFELRFVEDWPYFYVQPKLNGCRCRAVFDSDGTVSLFSSQVELKNFAVPHIVTALESSGLRSVELDGELYCHGMFLQDIMARTSRTVERHPDYEAIQYHIFDVVADIGQAVRFECLMVEAAHALEKSENIRIVATDAVKLVDNAIKILWDSYIPDGYEGMILRHPHANYTRKRTKFLLKYKPRQRGTFMIIRTNQEFSIHNEPKDALGSLTLITEDRETFNCGTGPYLTRAMRASLWKKRDTLPGSYAKIAFPYFSRRGVPKEPSLLEIKEYHDG